jgi:predicted nucleotide-binding protein (sugar kinase/HSP70/actin superfamily)
MTLLGLPRGFAFYLYPDFFETFFKSLARTLDFDVVVSGIATVGLMEDSAAFSESEHCYSHKIFDAHLFSLLGRVDVLFIPRILSMTKHYVSCAKFGALPDAGRSLLLTMARAVKRDHVPRVLTVDINETKEGLEKTMLRFGVSLGAEKSRVKKAFEGGRAAMDAAFAEQRRRNAALPQGKRFLLIGHAYILGEPLIMSGVLKKLTSLGIPPELMTFEARPLPFKGGFSPFGKPPSFEMPSPIRWCAQAKIEQRLSSLDREEYSGVIQAGVFNCGPDSVMTGRFRELCAARGVPFLELMFDGHTGQAGIDTRIEAFADSIGL